MIGRAIIGCDATVLTVGGEQVAAVGVVGFDTTLFVGDAADDVTLHDVTGCGLPLSADICFDTPAVFDVTAAGVMRFD